jgi:NAD(P)-dependent dehydrogenase (short-subunit alcohol dehydrogenase family)
MTDSPFRIDGHAAIITGGGRGLGRAFAVALAKAGADCIVVARRKDDLDETVRLVSQAGRRAYPVPGDVTEPQTATHAVEAAMREFGRLDILVNNAGILSDTMLDETELDDFRRVLDVNVTGTFLFCKAAATVFKSQGHGKVINISSILGLKGAPGCTAYCASKGAVILLTRSLAAEWAPLGIQVNAIAPGLFNTDMSKGIFENEDLHGMIMAGIPRGKHGEPDDLEGTIVFLASPASDHTVGQTLHIDGGASIV